MAGIENNNVQRVGTVDPPGNTPLHPVPGM